MIYDIVILIWTSQDHGKISLLLKKDTYPTYTRWHLYLTGQNHIYVPFSAPHDSFTKSSNSSILINYTSIPVYYLKFYQLWSVFKPILALHIPYWGLETFLCQKMVSNFERKECFILNLYNLALPPRSLWLCYAHSDQFSRLARLEYRGLGWR